MHIVITTTDRDLPALQSLLLNTGVPDDPASGVIFAGTPLSGAPVYRLGGIIRPNGSSQQTHNLGSLLTDSEDSFGTHPISNEDLTDPEILRAWWYLTTGNYGAVAPLARVSRGRNETAEQAKVLIERAEAHLLERKEALTLPIENIIDFGLAQTLADHMEVSGIPGLRDARRTLMQALRDAQRVSAMADELRARNAFYQLQEMAASRRTRDHMEATEGFEQLASTFPETVWGGRAQKRLALMANR